MAGSRGRRRGLAGGREPPPSAAVANGRGPARPRTRAGQPRPRSSTEEGADLERLDNETAQAQVEAAEAQLASARAQVVSAQSQVTASQSQVAASRSQVANAQSQATGASEQAEPDDRPLRRWTGTVSERLVEPGEAVSPGQSLFTVVNTSALELAGQVSVDAAARIRVGDPVEFTIDAYPGDRFGGTVARIEPTADASTRQIGVYLRLSNPGPLVGGLFATGTVISNTIEDALLVPESAVREGDGTAYLLLVDGDTIQQRPVTIEARDETRGLVAVRGEITAGTTVIVSPTTDTVSGVRVRLAGDRAAGSASSAAPVSPTVPPRQRVIQVFRAYTRPYGSSSRPSSLPIS